MINRSFHLKLAARMVCLNCGKINCSDATPLCAVACMHQLTNRVAQLEKQVFTANLFVHPVLNNTGKVLSYTGPRSFEQITSDGKGNFWALSFGSLFHCKITIRGRDIEINETSIGFSQLVNEIIAFSARDGVLDYALDSKGGIFGWHAGMKMFVLFDREWPAAIAKPAFDGKIRKMVTTTGGNDPRYGRHYILDERNLGSYSLDFFSRNEVFEGDATDFFVKGADVYIPSGHVTVYAPWTLSTEVFSVGDCPARCIAVENDVIIVGHNDQITLCRNDVDRTVIKKINFEIPTLDQSPGLKSMLLNKNGSLILHYGDNKLYMVV